MKPMPSRNVLAELEALDEKINRLLPPRYQHCYDSVPPVSMGSAGLKRDADGKVAWDQIWTTFCDLALAGGPPHRGKLMAPVTKAEATADPDRYAEIVAEIDRAVGLTVGMAVVPGYAPGWVGVPCASVNEAAWLQFAINAENVSAQRRGMTLQLPASSAFRVEKEIKNLVVSLIKSLHYWDGHLTNTQQTLAAAEIWEPATPDEIAANPDGYEAILNEVEQGLETGGLPVAAKNYPGWIGIDTGSEEDAVWLLRAVLVERVLARREENMLYLAVGATPDADLSARTVQAFNHALELKNASTPRQTWKPSGRSQ